MIIIVIRLGLNTGRLHPPMANIPGVIVLNLIILRILSRSVYVACVCTHVLYLEHIVDGCVKLTYTTHFILHSDIITHCLCYQNFARCLSSATNLKVYPGMTNNLHPEQSEVDGVS